jgi:hypothetical protein
MRGGRGRAARESERAEDAPCRPSSVEERAPEAITSPAGGSPVGASSSRSAPLDVLARVRALQDIDHAIGAEDPTIGDADHRSGPPGISHAAPERDQVAERVADWLARVGVRREEPVQRGFEAISSCMPPQGIAFGANAELFGEAPRGRADRALRTPSAGRWNHFTNSISLRRQVSLKKGATRTQQPAALPAHTG